MKHRMRVSLSYGCLFLALLLLFSACPWPKPRPKKKVPPSTIEVDGSLSPDRATLPGPSPEDAPRPVDRLVDGKGRPSDFVRGELVITSHDENAVAALTARWGGKVVYRFDPREVGVAEGVTTYLVRIDPLQVDQAHLIKDLGALEPSTRADLRVSSAEGLGTLAAAAHVARSGATVGINWLSLSTGFIDRNVTDAPNGPAGYTPNAAQWSYMRAGGNQDIGVADAWRALAVAGKLGNRIPVAVIDGGFARNADLAPGSLHVSAWPGANLDESNDMKGDDWHGTQVAQVLAGVAGNQAGVAGVGAPVVWLQTIRSIGDMFTVITAVHMAAPARIINMSFTIPVPATLSWTVLPLNVATQIMSIGRLLFAAAGNDNENVDGEDCVWFVCWEERWYYPCENDGVTCIGGIAHDATGKAAGSNYGEETVHMYAPYHVLVGADPAHPREDEARWSAGTSFSSPFVAGVAALVWAVNPTMSAGQVWDLITSTAHAGTDGVVPRYVNARAAVLKALGPVPPMVEIINTMTTYASTIGGLLPAELRAQVGDLVDDLPDLQVTWSSDVDGVLGTGPEIKHVFRTPGPRQVTVTVRNRRGESASRTITHTVSMGSLSVTISAPAEGSGVYRQQPVYLRGSALSHGGAVPCDKITWTVNRLPAWSARGCDVTANLDILGDAIFTATARLDSGPTGSAQRRVVYAEVPVSGPTITALDISPDGGFRTTEFRLRGVVTSPAGTPTYRWMVMDPFQNKLVEIGTSSDFTWQLPAEMRLRCRGMDLEFQLTVTDPNGKSATRSKKITIDFGPC